MLSEGLTVHREVAPPFVEGTIVYGSRSARARWERPGQAPDPRLVLHRIEDVIDEYPEWDEVGLCFTSLTGFSSTPSCLVNGGGIVTRILPRGGYGLGFSTSGPCLGGQLDAAQIASSIWMYFCAWTRISPILVTSFFTRCL